MQSTRIRSATAGAQDLGMNLRLTRTGSRTSKHTILRHLDSLAGCSDRELDAVAQLTDEARLQQGAHITEQGASGRQAFVIVEGWAAVLIDGEPVAALGPGDIFGEMSMLDHKARSATVVAKTEMHVLVIGPEAFASFAQQPAIARRLTTMMAERLRRADAALARHDPDKEATDDD
jgi:CRP-like cAMP-binding protein